VQSGSSLLIKGSDWVGMIWVDGWGRNGMVADMVTAMVKDMVVGVVKESDTGMVVDTVMVVVKESDMVKLGWQGDDDC